jgi:nitroreductase
MNMVQFDDVSGAEDITREKLLRFIRKRRSHRHFKDKVVPRADLEALVDVCRYAPTGSNTQKVEILVITDQEKIKRLSSLCIEHFVQTVAQTEKKPANPSSPGKELPADIAFAQKWTAMMQRHINAWNDNRDTVLRKAPVVMVFHSTPHTSTPKDDCVIAAHTVVLHAMTLGLETCYIGLLEISAAASPAIMEELGLPDGNEVYSVLILGYPKYRFLRAVDRKPIKASWA